MGFRVIDEKCLSDKFRGRRRTGVRAPLAIAPGRHVRYTPLDNPNFQRLIVVCFHRKFTFESVTINVTVNAFFPLSPRNRVQRRELV